MQKLPETERKRNCLAIRWNDADMKRVSDEAYSKRISCSGLIREIVMERLHVKDASQEQIQAGIQPTT